jgi:hypothetical protein
LGGAKRSKERPKWDKISQRLFYRCTGQREAGTGEDALHVTFGAAGGDELAG